MTIIDNSTIRISKNVSLSINEIELNFIRAQGSGGQNVNKVSTAVHLRFDIQASSLPIKFKEKLMQLKDHHISKDGIIIIKAQAFRSQEKNRDDAYRRLVTIIRKTFQKKKKRKPTKPTLASKRRRLDSKTRRGQQKVQRRKVEY